VAGGSVLSDMLKNLEMQSTADNFMEGMEDNWGINFNDQKQLSAFVKKERTNIKIDQEKLSTMKE